MKRSTKQADLSGLKPPAEQGTLSIRANALARLVGTTPEAVGAIVGHSVDLGLLEYRDGTDTATGRLVVRSLKRGAWEPQDATAAARAAKSKRGHGDLDGGDAEEADTGHAGLPF